MINELPGNPTVITRNNRAFFIYPPGQPLDVLPRSGDKFRRDHNQYWVEGMISSQKGAILICSYRLASYAWQ